MFTNSMVRGGAMLAASVLLAATPATRAEAQISVVVAASSGLTATESQIADMFTGGKTTWANGARVQVVDQPDTDTGKAFYSGFLKQPVAQIRTQWTKLVLSGQAPAPKKESGSDGVKKSVAGTSGAIGYIATADLDGTVKEIFRIK